MKKQSKILLFETIICITLIVISFILSHYVYVDVYNMDFAVTTLTSLVVVTIIYWKKETKAEPPRFRWLTIVIICIVVIAFLVTKPNYTYEQGKMLLRDQDYESIESLKDRSLLSFELERNYFIRSAYLYTGVKNKEGYYIQVHPDSGEIVSLKIGEGNYIDNYLKLKEEME